MIKAILYTLLLASFMACQSGIKFEQVEFEKQIPLAEGDTEGKGFYYNASLLWSNGTPEFNKWLLESVGLKNITSKNALLDSLEADLQKNYLEYRDFNLDMGDFAQSWSIDRTSRVIYKCPNYVSIEAYISTQTGGAHNRQSSVKHSWFLKENRVVLQDDIFKRGKEDVIRPHLMDALMEMWDCDRAELNRILDYKPLPILNFALAHDTIQFFYPYYTIAPRVYGEPTIPISCKDIADALTDYAKKLIQNEE